MELLEIIYNSLFYFVIIAALILIGAFIAHKTRKKLDLLPKEDIVPELKPKLKTRNGKPIEKKKPSQRSSRKEDKIIKKKKVSPKSVKKDISTIKVRRENEENIKPKTRISTKTTNRIEILNTNKTKTFRNSSKVDLSQTSKDDLLKLYSDSDEDDLNSF